MTRPDEHSAGSAETGDAGSHDRGQAVSLILIAITLVVLIAVEVTDVAGDLTRRSRAQNAADAAALAGVHGGTAAASESAGRNGALLVSFHSARGEQGVSVLVVVSVGDQQAIAAASDEP